MTRPVSPLTISSAEARRIDAIAVEQLGMSPLVLMENAGRETAAVLWGHAPRSVAIACGHGNNGGDGFVVARHLALRHLPVRVLVTEPEERLRPDVAANYRILQHCGVPVCQANVLDSRSLRTDWLADADWFVDALLGTGTRLPLREPILRVLAAANQPGLRRLAVDLPSGMDADTGRCDPQTLTFDCTCTFVAPKHGMATEVGRAHCGEVHIISIGTPDIVLQRAREQPDAGAG